VNYVTPLNIQEGFRGRAAASVDSIWVISWQFMLKSITMDWVMLPRKGSTQVCQGWGDQLPDMTTEQKSYIVKDKTNFNIRRYTLSEG